MSKSKKITIIAVVALALAIILAAGAWFFTRPETTEGSKNITFTVVYKDKTSEKFEISTDALFLAEALVEKELIVYDASGLYTTINGVTADYSVDGGWWCIYEGDEPSNLGLNDIPVTDGGVYEAVYTTEFVS